MDHRVRIVVALPQEAEPLRDLFDLTGDPDRSSFKVYQGEEVVLVVSGTGVLKAASAVPHLFHKTGAFWDAPWLNLGVAGHRDAELGTPFLVDKVEDQSLEANWYPQVLFDSPLERATVRTVPSPSESYEEEVLYDMEASGFFSSALKFTTLELAQVLKIVSDNKDHSLEHISTGDVQRRIEAQGGTIKSVVASLKGLSEEFHQFQEPPEAYEALRSRFHFTFTESVQLKRLLDRWQALRPESSIQEFIEDQQCQSGTQVLQDIRSSIEE